MIEIMMLITKDHYCSLVLKVHADKRIHFILLLYRFEVKTAILGFVPQPYRMADNAAIEFSTTNHILGSEREERESRGVRRDLGTI